MRTQTILFLLVDRVREKLDCRPYRDGEEGNPKRLVVAARLAFSNRSNILTLRPAVCHDSNNRGGKGEMTKAPISLQDPRRSLYIKVKAEPSPAEAGSR